MRYFLATIFAALLIPALVHAATLSLKGNTEASVGDQLFVDVVAQTEGNAINSIEASVQYPEELLSFAGYQDSAGVIKLWIEQPRAQKGSVHFIGGIPGGVDRSVGGPDSSITLVRLIFTPTKTGSAELHFSNSTLLLNDGKGTELSHTTMPLAIAVREGGSSAVTDTNPPKAFSISYIPRDSASGTPSMITFGTEDRESGIQKYQVRSTLGFWKTAQSPYQLRSSIFSRVVYVKAIDVYGNAQVSKITVPGLIPLWTIYVVLVIALGSVWRLFMVKKKI